MKIQQKLATTLGIGLLLCMGCTKKTAEQTQEITPHLKNTKHDPKAIPILDEPPLAKTNADEAWTESEFQKADCEQPTYELDSDYENRIIITTLKNKTAPVEGELNRFRGRLVQTGSELLQGKMVVDLASWDSQNGPRDTRVKRYVFGLEDGKSTLSKVAFSVLTKDAVHTLEGTASFRDHELPLKAEAIVEKSDEALSLKLKEPGRFTYVTQPMMKSMMDFLARCNHEFLSSFVDYQVDLKFKSVCQKPAAESQR